MTVTIRPGCAAMTGADSQRLTALIRRQHTGAEQRAEMTPDDWRKLEADYRAHRAKWQQAVLQMRKAAVLLESLPNGHLNVQTKRNITAQIKRLNDLTETEE